ncbi:MAG: hypothetical protein GX201_03370 [Clostridiales bacterium]|nr:hypothetical protein [Clostridiales bacterium]
MEEKDLIKSEEHCDPLLNDIRVLLEILNSLVSSYRLLVGAADEFNKITLASKSDLEHAIKRADNVGDIIDVIDDKLKMLIKALIKKIEYNYNKDFNKEL